MSEEIKNPINPFVARTTFVIDRANRLMGLKAHPGFNDLITLSQQTVTVAQAALVDYQGWDKDELVARSIAFRAAVKSHEMLFTRLVSAIQEGVMESVQQKSDQLVDMREADAMAEDLRVEVFRQMDEAYDSRVPGSF